MQNIFVRMLHKTNELVNDRRPVNGAFTEAYGDRA